MHYLLLFVLGYGLGLGAAYNKNLESTKTFYKESCIARKNQISVMKWVDGKPTCTRSETLVKSGNDLTDWRE